jgi:hypothetical protein
MVKKMPDKYLPWTCRRYHFSDAHIQMVRELGLNPKKFGGLANTRQEPWKAPLPEFRGAVFSSTSRKVGLRTYGPSSRW